MTGPHPGAAIRWGSKTPHLAEIEAAWNAGVRGYVIDGLFGFSPGYTSHLARRMGWRKRRQPKPVHVERWPERAAIASLHRDGG